MVFFNVDVFITTTATIKFARENAVKLEQFA